MPTRAQAPIGQLQLGAGSSVPLATPAAEAALARAATVRGSLSAVPACRPRTPRRRCRYCGRRPPGADPGGLRPPSHAQRRRSRPALYPQRSPRPPGLPRRLRRRPGPAQLRLRARLQLPSHPQPAAHRAPRPAPRRQCGLLVRGEPAGVPHSPPHPRVLILFPLRLRGVGWRDRGPWPLVTVRVPRPS